MHIVGPELNARPQCEAVLRSLPMWFGIEEALQMYADDTLRLPTFAACDDHRAAGVAEGEGDGERIVGFVTLMKHFEHAWEVYCIALHAEFRDQGIGRALLGHAEAWLIAQGVSLLQVKTVAATSASAAYGLTRGFYDKLGFQPLEVFPTLWSVRNPALQLVKFLAVADPSRHRNQTPRP